MKKKLICTLLAYALVLCAASAAVPGVTAHACNVITNGPNIKDNPNVYNNIIDNSGVNTGNTTISSGITINNNNISLGGVAPSIVDPRCLPDVYNGAEPYDGPELWDDGFVSRWKVWVERTRSEDNEKLDKIVMDLVPVDEGLLEEYKSYYEDFTDWDAEGALFYAPAGGFYTNQVSARLYEFIDHHRNGGHCTIEVGLFTERYAAPEGPVYYEHRAFEESSIDYDLAFYAGDLKVLVDKEYAKADLNFAARPDGKGGWEIILKDLDGNDVGYSIVN